MSIENKTTEQRLIETQEKYERLLEACLNRRIAFSLFTSIKVLPLPGWYCKNFCNT